MASEGIFRMEVLFLNENHFFDFWGLRAELSPSQWIADSTLEV